MRSTIVAPRTQPSTDFSISGDIIETYVRARPMLRRISQVDLYLCEVADEARVVHSD